MIPIELIVQELKRLVSDYYNCDDPILKESILSDIELLSKALFLSDLPDDSMSEY
ncbi:hypothetical protein [Sutcliffiella cohnii]|uniref:hypothetical protein n=1 Tax=Sutcliffiella cohnii TaxID=33932 RepID=UPI002E1D516C|nr:hypothetical protein [Sutcliffiella cohnii]